MSMNRCRPSQQVTAFLTAQERAALTAFVDLRDANNWQPVRLVVSSGLDDCDDHQALLGLLTLERFGLVELVAVVAGLQAAELRARAIKGILSHFGLDVPVIVGSDRSPRDLTEISILSDAGQQFFAPPQAVHRDTVGSLMTALQAAPHDRGVTLVGLASFSDFCDLQRHHPKLFANRVEKVALMTGVQQRDEHGDTDVSHLTLADDGKILANEIAVNNVYDLDSTHRLFAAVQDAGIDLTIVTRSAAYAAGYPPQVFEVMATLGDFDPVARFIYDSARRLTQKFWIDTLDHRGPRSKQWFVDTFLDGRDPFHTLSKAQQKLIPMLGHIRRMIPYDLLCVLASVDDGLVDCLFAPVTREFAGARQQVIGLSTASPGVQVQGSIHLPSLIGALTKYPVLERVVADGLLA